MFNGTGNDRANAPNVLILFTDGQTLESNKTYQVNQAKNLKDDGVKIITVGMGKKNTINKFRGKLRQMASAAGDSGEPLMFEANITNLDSIANNIISETCDVSDDQ